MKERAASFFISKNSRFECLKIKIEVGLVIGLLFLRFSFAVEERKSLFPEELKHKNYLLFQTEQANYVCTATLFFTSFRCFQRKGGGEGYRKTKEKFTPMVSWEYKANMIKILLVKNKTTLCVCGREKSNAREEISSTIENYLGCPLGDGTISSELLGDGDLNNGPYHVLKSDRHLPRYLQV